MSRYLLLVRHGETVGNSEEIAHGQTESPLNERGLSQAKHTAELLKNWERKYHRVYSSPMSRAHNTAQQISDAMGLPLHTHHDLKEGSLGDWEGITYEQLAKNEFAKKSIQDNDFNGHNGESPRMLSSRMHDAIQFLRGQHEGENLILVSHGAAIAHGLARLLGRQTLFGPKYIMHNSAVTEIVMEPEPELIHLNYHDHLPDELRSNVGRADNKTHSEER